ncbi:MAG: 4-oxalocrotonate tautomerase [Armatimonadetes bacterium]|nr:4-oxalocrotonate tautomerase [Armatimonadota bacterium]
MPIVTLTISHLDAGKKRALAEGFTKVAAEATGIPEEKFIVIFDEKPRDSIAVGGKLLADQ